MSVDVSELDDEHEQRHDYRRANGAPMVSDPEDPNRTARYRRPSGYGKVLDDESALVDWRIWKAMQGVAASKAIQAAVGATSEDDKVEKKRLREQALDKGSANEAADSGTALHKMTQRYETPGDFFEPPEEYLPDLEAYSQALLDYGLVSEYIEVHMVNDSFRAAGTADRLYRTQLDLTMPDGSTMPAGSLILGDIKTGKKMDFGVPGYCVQMALYADGILYDIHTEQRVDTPEINKNWSLIVHLPVGKATCTLLWVSIPLGLHGAWIANEVKEWQKLWKNGTYDSHVAELPQPAEAPIESQTQWTTPEMIAEIEPSVMVEYIRQRIATIGDTPDAKRDLMLAWPEKLPTPKQGLVERADIVRVLNLLDKVEAKHSIPFPTDPRSTLYSGLNKSQIPTGNDHGIATV